MKIPGEDNSILHALFPTMVFQKTLDDHNTYAPLFDTQMSEFGFQPEVGDGGKHFAGEYHGQILLHQQPALRPFFEQLALQVSVYLKSLGMKPEFFEMRCLKSWFVFCEPGGEEADAMIAHNHSCSDISWVYYVDVPDDCPAIRFHNGRRLNTAPFESAFHYDWSTDEKSAVSTINWWNSETWSLQPQAGDLLMFPGHQLHSVDSNHCEQTRISVAGDIALVLRKEFTDLEFGRANPAHWLNLPLGE